ncbi:MAG: alpha-isopropylmalate synthase regulatory domain-containing protein, partial [Desulfosporosinus sp.]
ARSGRHALQYRLEELGYSIEGAQLDDVYQRFLQLADLKKEVLDQDLYVLMGDSGNPANNIVLQNMSIATNGLGQATATVILEIEGEMLTDAACGNGPVNALFNTIDRITGNLATLEDYTLKSVTRSSEALGEATVKLRYDNGRLVVGKGFSTDIIQASAKAYINALEK